MVPLCKLSCEFELPNVPVEGSGRSGYRDRSYSVVHGKWCPASREDWDGPLVASNLGMCWDLV